MSGSKKTVLMIGGTGAQGAAVVKALSDDSAYEIRVLTRSAASPAAAELAALPDVTIMEGNPYEEATLQHAFDAVELAWVNTNGFAIGGEERDLLGHTSGVSHFQWASLPYVSKLGDFDPKYRTGHMDGKGKVADYISAQPTSPMKWTILTSCMYMETLTELLAPRQSPEDPDLTVFAAPLGNGRPPLIYLADLGRYARWVFDNPGRSNGMNLMVATENIGWECLAKTFTEVTGKKAIYKDISLDELFTSGAFPFPDRRVGHSVSMEDPHLAII
ncbi:hypothetical protein RAB80_012786 [Fusarium oxysporum f. sp. vasinfectum]|nr:hypothetical protein RAB80_012786 [Fusarium oxysporum f. sp. vasinfectum]